MSAPDALHAPEAEMAVLGAIVADPGATGRIAELDRGLFFGARNRLIAEAIRAIHGRGGGADAVEVLDELRRGHRLEEAGGSEYLARLVDAVPSADGFDRHVRILRDRATLRALRVRLRALDEATQNGAGGRPLELIETAVGDLLDLSRSADRGEYVHAGDLVMSVFDEIEEARARGSEVTGLPTGIGKFDRMTSGLHAGQLVVVGGRASVGKTAVAITFARHAALEAGVPVGIFSLEMSRTDVVKRVLAAESRIPFTRLRVGSLSEDDYARLAHAAGVVKTMPLLIDDTADLTAIELRGRARRMVERDRAALLIVDYLQLVRTPGAGTRNREQEVAEVSRTCKAVARELEVPVVALSQLSRAPTQRANQRPVLSDLRESGAIEQDADVVVFPYRPNQDPGGDGSARYPGAVEDAELVIRKQRNGATGVVRAIFDGQLMAWKGAE